MQRAGNVIGKLKLPPKLADPELRARAAWAPAAGEKIARHTRAVSLVRGTLIVEVNDPLWQRNLNGLRKFLLENLETVLGEPIVSALDFRPVPMRREPQRATAARQGAENIEDPVLRMLYNKSKKQAAG